ncbi:MAG: hypothetical protein IJ562_10895 [Prevotella sp.]|nr:hypothetical protein [Prevotella sp.]
MTIHIFNPEHDIALAFNRKHLTMPHAAQELRMNMGWIPAIWASDVDVVLVDDISFAIKASSRFKDTIADVLFVERADLPDLMRGIKDVEIQPWGWDLTLRTQLSEAGVAPDHLPTDRQLQEIRHYSSRVQTVSMLKKLRSGIEEDTCGMSMFLTSEEMLADLLQKKEKLVLKAPWSSSGRGIRYVDGDISPSLAGWYKRILEVQGGIMVEPYYRKVKDFGMEFVLDGDGNASYLGLSLFATINNAYVGNLLATEEEKEKIISKYIPLTLLHEVRNRICAEMPRLVGNCYAGPFGIDMMIVAKEDANGYLLHPCVEINLRRTMGHVSLAVKHEPTAPNQLMMINHGVNYVLKISNIDNNYVLTL